MTQLNAPARGIPLPHPSALTEPFWKACRDRQLLFQRCEDCAKAIFPPEPACTRCLSPHLAWTPSSGLGRIHSYTIMWHAQQPSFTCPYAVAVVEMEEGHYVLANVVDAHAEDLAVDMAVAADFVPVSDDSTLPVFRPWPGN
jgi:uncharacterized protein